MIKFLVAILSMTSLNAVALSIDDLKPYDNMECDIERIGENSVRILTTNFNSNSNRYLDLNLNSEGWTSTPVKDGMEFNQTVDLSKGLHRPYPSWMYGKRRTTLFLGKGDRGNVLTVIYVASDLGFGLRFGKTAFECGGSDFMTVDKSAVCKTCISNR